MKIRNVIYNVLCQIVDKIGRPGVNSYTAGSTRYFLKFAGLTITQTDYLVAQRAYSGDPIGIVSSLWIHSTKRALGWGVTQPWAHLRNIEIEIGGQRYSTENGDLILNPPAKANHRLLTVRNAHKNVPASVNMVAFAEGRGLSDDGCATFWFNNLGAEQSVRFDASACVNIGQVRYKTIPNGEWSLNRLYGRPEWEASQNSDKVKV
jgi:hypothetical protein